MLQLLVISSPSPGCNKVTEKKVGTLKKNVNPTTLLADCTITRVSVRENMRQKTEVQPKAFPVWDVSNLIAVNNAVDLMSKTRLASN